MISWIAGEGPHAELSVGVKSGAPEDVAGVAYQVRVGLLVGGQGGTQGAVAATAAALNVVEPYMSGLAGAGGAAFFLAADSKVETIDFIPPVPEGFDASLVDKAKTESGPNAPVTPGNLAGWHALQSRHGRLKFDQVLQPAIRLAEEGFPVSSFFVAMNQGSVGRIQDLEWRRVFRAEQNWQPGQVLQLPDLAATLAQIAADGTG